MRGAAVVDGDGLADAVAGLPGCGPAAVAGLRAAAALRDVPILVLGRFAGGRQRADLTLLWISRRGLPPDPPSAAAG
ncbi:hypothetical protein [Azospirillum sp. TSO35-2]|uniref:hypothetical protein n=1 Tax=Azospirillum sp. TSO35-2 TaxID=716796 RepID=UPI000D607E71|nr:hypothetical protein [Azospirillum sp. TSO35-2]PWC31109.1 hypothetical protein TSO352_30235 [Azospirillum sp. TSO35-2]